LNSRRSDDEYLRSVGREESYQCLGHDDYNTRARARVILDEVALGLTATEVGQALKDGNPAIYIETRPGMTSRSDKGSIVLNPHCLQEGEEVIVAERLQQILRV
jgi:hypothetical protein